MKEDIDKITGDIVDAAYKIHSKLGPGLLESVYEIILANELEKRGYHVERQKELPFDFEGTHFETGLRVDLMVDGIVVVELKSTEQNAPVYFKQVLTYLRLLDLPVGLLINFGSATLKEGLRRVVNHYISPTDAALRINKSAAAISAAQREINPGT
ncbi:MAG: GxxExxY protein [Anaerolineae bacterium]